MTSSLIVYDVDEAWRVTSTRRFQLCRVAFCSAALHPSDRRLLAWLYHPPPLQSASDELRCARLETYVVRLSSQLRARRLAVRIGAAFARLHAEVEAAQAVERLQAADERRSRTAQVNDDSDTTTSVRKMTASCVSDLAAVQYLQYSNAAYDDDECDVQTFETFRPALQTTVV